MSATWDHYTWWRARREHAWRLRQLGLKYREVAERLGVGLTRAKVLSYYHEASLKKGEDYGWQDGKRQRV